MVPSNLITCEGQMRSWEISEGRRKLESFIEAVNGAVLGRSIEGVNDVTENISCIVKMLEYLNAKITDFPPDNEPQRFGNRAFNTYYQWMKSDLLQIMNKFIFNSISDEKYHTKAEECGMYLLEGIGHPQRIDYGSGHELSFIAFLVTMFEISFLDSDMKLKSDVRNVALIIMPKYLEFVRNLQRTYNFEPAGSRGVHALDDFQFVPFIWGSSQLINQRVIRPDQIPSAEIATSKKNDNLFFSCIDFIFQVKSGPFSEHSNTLYNISSVPNWKKLNEGMLKMFKGEVLSKFVIIQHFLFGTFFTLEQVERQFRVPNLQDSLTSRCC